MTFNDPTDDEPEEGGKPLSIRQGPPLPEKYEPKCKVCTSPYRHAIERMVALGTPYAEIERVFNNEVPRRSISNHAKEHLRYEEAAIQRIIQQEAQSLQMNEEEGVRGALQYRAFLRAGIERAWRDVIEGNTRISPAVAVQMIQQMEKFESNSEAVALEELRFQFECIMEAIRRVVPSEQWHEINTVAQQLANSDRPELEP